MADPLINLDFAKQLDEHEQELERDGVLGLDPPFSRRNFDSECEGLARYFLSDESNVPEAAVKELAEQLQETITDFLQFDLPTLRSA